LNDGSSNTIYHENENYERGSLPTAPLWSTLDSSIESFDKRGTYVFLMERVKRLEIPFAIYSFFISPFCLGGFEYLFFYRGDLSFSKTVFSSGTTRVLMQPIMFNVVYTFACDKEWSPKISCPSFCGARFVQRYHFHVLP
jgi:hypothetical protein